MKAGETYVGKYDDDQGSDYLDNKLFACRKMYEIIGNTRKKSISNAANRYPACASRPLIMRL